MSGWYYRIRRKRCPQTKEWVYDVVEWFSGVSLPIGKPYKIVEENGHKVAYYRKYKRQNLWSKNSEAAMGMSKEEVLEQLSMMLKDCVKYPVFTQRKKQC